MTVTLAEELETPTERLSRESKLFDALDFRQFQFEWIKLKKKCYQLDLEDTYQLYMRKIFRNYLKTFMKIHVIIALIHSLAIILNNQRPDAIYIDCYLYLAGAILTCSCLCVYLKKDFVAQHCFIAHIVAWTSCIIMAFTDFLIGLMAYIYNEDILRPCYCGYTITCLYLFMPISNYMPLLCLGLFISSLYGIHAALISNTIEGDEMMRSLDISSFLPDLLFIVGLNVIGICFRLRRDYACRRVFLTRRLNIEEGLLLKYAKDQENKLLISIIPAQIAKKIGQEVKVRIERFKLPKMMKSQYASEFARKLFIEPHYDVSIIFADLVNYTQLTTTLDIKTLVETLHDLFQRFDTACREFNVMRIKFLGDCYYGVAGVPRTHPFHAHCCIEFGRSIIEQISEVRITRHLNIDMRIGIHSGNILSGIIGTTKWQYDIWSKDVDIASHIEQTSLPGRVHISMQTLEYVKDYYEFERGTEKARSDPLLVKEHIRTYLIIKPSIMITQSKEWNNYRNETKSKQLFKNNQYLEDTIVLDYNSIKTRANLQIAQDIKKLPIYKLGIMDQLFTRMPRLDEHEMEDFSANRNISTWCLWFSNWNWEASFNREKDELFTISTTMTCVVLGCIMGMQGSNKIIHNISSFVFVYAVAIISVILLMLFVWFRIIWTKFSTFPFRKPRQRCLLYFHQISREVEKNVLLRITIYVSLLFLMLLITFLHLISCDSVALENDDELMHEFLQGGKRTLCFNAWAVTESLVLCMAVLFTFNHIPYCIQLLFGISIALYYLIIIYIELPLVYECSSVTNKTIRAETSHIWNLLTILFIYQLMDRHIVYVSKIEAISKWRLEKKKDNALVTNESIKVLLHNILPSHVVNIYITKHMHNEPYYEQHDYVAVMFATIIYQRSGSIELRLLNEIICDFDEVLSYYKTPIKVEKIKVANWSYMAACGFDMPFDDMAFNDMSTTRQSLFLPNKRAFASMSSDGDYSIGTTSSYRSESEPNDDNDKDLAAKDFAESVANSEYGEANGTEVDDTSNNWQKRNILHTITNFALDLLRSMHSFNQANRLARTADEPDIQLRIGISSGEVMTGVVGSSQAHYDIWGNAVNMASRMDSTGSSGRIQVTSEAADILKTFNIVCKSRGKIYVKGRGKIPTYFVQYNDNFEFQHFS